MCEHELLSTLEYEGVLNTFAHFHVSVPTLYTRPLSKVLGCIVVLTLSVTAHEGGHADSRHLPSAFATAKVV